MAHTAVDLATQIGAALGTVAAAAGIRKITIEFGAGEPRAKHIPLKLPAKAIFDTTAEPAPESKPALRMLNGGKR